MGPAIHSDSDSILKMGRGGAPDALDEMFAYQTVKMVNIKNKKLGLLHYFFMFLIAMYLTVYVFIMEKKYLTLDTPVGTTRFSTMGPCQPLSGHADKLCTEAPASGMASVGENCTGAFMCDRLPYCLKKGATNESKLAGGSLPCIYADHNTVTWPPSERNSFTLATRISQYRQKLRKGGLKGKLCAPPVTAKGIDSLAQLDWDCQYEPTVSSGLSVDGYVASIGNYTVRMAHAVMGSSLPIAATGLSMSGRLLRCIPGKDCSNYLNFESIKDFVPGPENGGDATMTINEILDAVVPLSHIGLPKGTPGLDLDATSAACPGKCKDPVTGDPQLYSMRYKGVVIMIETQYDNTGLIIEGSSAGHIKYSIRFWANYKSTFGVEVPYSQLGSERLVNHMYGLRFVTMAKGHFGLPSLHAVIIQLTTSVAMLLLSTTIMDIVLTKFLLNSEYYRFVKYEQDEERLNQMENYLASADNLSAEEKQARLDHAMNLRQESGLDWKAAFTGGMCSGAPEVPEDLFDQQVIKKVGEEDAPVGYGSGSGSGSNSDIAPPPEMNEQSPLMQRPGEQAKACCVVS